MKSALSGKKFRLNLAYFFCETRGTPISNLATLEMQAGTPAAEAEAKALRVESNRLKEEAGRLREERQAKEKELADARLELATVRRTSDAATESLKSGIS